MAPQSGHLLGITKAFSLPSRRSTTGPKISGMTSPAFRITTVSPISTPLALTTSWLCKVANSIVEPATFTGSTTAYGVARPVLPIETLMSRSLVFTCSGGYLKAIAQRGALAVKPSSRCSPSESTFTTTPSISCSKSCRCSLKLLM